MLEAEVNNGGFNQSFFNSWSDDWRDALEGLSAIGAASNARILERAVATFGPSGKLFANVVDKASEGA